MNRIKSPIRNKLASSTTDYLIRISMIGPDNSEWDPIEAARTWEKMGNRKMTVLTSASNVVTTLVTVTLMTDV